MYKSQGQKHKRQILYIQLRVSSGSHRKSSGNLLEQKRPNCHLIHAEKVNFIPRTMSSNVSAQTTGSPNKSCFPKSYSTFQLRKPPEENVCWYTPGIDVYTAKSLWNFLTAFLLLVVHYKIFSKRQSSFPYPSCIKRTNFIFNCLLVSQEVMRCLGLAFSDLL